MSVPRNFSAWIRLMRPCINGSRICSRRQPKRKTSRDLKTKMSRSVGEVFLPSDSGLWLNTKHSNCRIGMPQSRWAVTNSMKTGSGGTNSTQPANCGRLDSERGFSDFITGDECRNDWLQDRSRGRSWHIQIRHGRNRAVCPAAIRRCKRGKPTPARAP